MTISDEQRKAYGLLYATVSLSLDQDIPAGQRIDIAAGMVAEAAQKDMIERVDRTLIDWVCDNALTEAQEDGFFAALKVFRDTYLPTEDTDQ